MRKILTAALLFVGLAAMAQNPPVKNDSTKQNNFRRGPRMDTQDPNAHDPVMAKGEDDRYYVFMTGMNVGVMSSADLKT